MPMIRKMSEMGPSFVDELSISNSIRHQVWIVLILHYTQNGLSNQHFI